MVEFSLPKPGFFCAIFHYRVIYKVVGLSGVIVEFNAENRQIFILNALNISYTTSMTFDALYEYFHDQDMFDVNSVKVYFPHESDSTIRTSLYRYIQEKKLVGLRRGLYAFQEPYKKRTLDGGTLANQLYYPSYLSERWALSWYGVIPEKVLVYTSITSRRTQQFTNLYGTFRYRTIKLNLFSGFQSVDVSGHSMIIAEPEKALLDLWHLEHGEWTPERLDSWRINPSVISLNTLRDWVDLTKSPRMKRAYNAWEVYESGYDEGVII